MSEGEAHSETIARSTVTKIRGYVMCAQKVLGGSDAHGALMPIFLEKYLSSATLRALYSSYLFPAVSQRGRSHPEPLFCSWRKRGREEAAETDTVPSLSVTVTVKLQASTFFPQHLLLFYRELLIKEKYFSLY